MVVLRLANFYIASIRETLCAVNVMTARDLARIQKDGGGGGGVHVLSTPSKIMLIIEYVQWNTKTMQKIREMDGYVK